METLIDHVKRLEEKGIFLGGPVHLFEKAGRNILTTLLNEGVYPYSKVLDVGCGCLRGGYWLIHFLEKNCYFGIEPNVDMIEQGCKILLEPDILNQKTPHFDYNDHFDFTVFGEKFDFIIARSIWTHTSKEQILKMLDGFVNTAHSDATFLTSYIRPSLFRKDYKGEKWVGKSHESNIPGIIRHSFRWIKSECLKRNLIAQEIKREDYNFGGQTWLRIKFNTP